MIPFICSIARRSSGSLGLWCFIAITFDMLNACARAVIFGVHAERGL
jgi:hypothetical protein